GSGMVMAVPAHDQRDFEFATKYDIPIKVVVEPTDYEIYERNGKIPRAYEGEGTLTNSEEFNGLKTDEAKEKITQELENKELGKKSTQYKLKDWLISRQRYWGTPIPVVNCEDCGQVPEKEENLPIELPDKVEFGNGNPLETNEGWIKTSCPNCGKEAKRDADTMDGFMDSSWYFFRYADPHNDKEPFQREKADHWMPVDQYIGGDEHACMHLIYARFFTKFLRDIGYSSIDEPFQRLFSQGMVLGPDGNKMSKSKGNVISPEYALETYGLDSVRLFLVSVASPDKDVLWSDEGANGSLRFVKRVYNFVSNFQNSESSKRLQHHLNKTVKQVTENISNFKYNLAVVQIRDLFEKIEKENSISEQDLESLIKMLNPFCPHITEELWENLGNENFISLSEWPKSDENAIEEFFEQQEEKTEKAASDAENVLNMLEEREGKKSKVYIYTLPNEKDYYESTEIERKTGKPVQIFAVNEEEKYDPENVSKKAKPGKPAIYVE
ncbi:MAG: class I tRNA ligase family protein, partial [Candidatus Pacearchaeota archaeon]